MANLLLFSVLMNNIVAFLLLINELYDLDHVVPREHHSSIELVLLAPLSLLRLGEGDAWGAYR